MNFEADTYILLEEEVLWEDKKSHEGNQDKATATLQLLLHCAHQALGVRGLGSDPASALKDPQSSGEEKYANTGLLCGVFSVITDTHKATDPTKSMTRSKGEISGLRERR